MLFLNLTLLRCGLFKKTKAPEGWGWWTYEGVVVANSLVASEKSLLSRNKRCMAGPDVSGGQRQSVRGILLSWHECPANTPAFP